MVSVELTPQQWAVIAQLINSVSGVDNVRVLTPIYDAIMAANKPKEESGED